MKQKRNHLDLVFRRIQPEVLWDALRRTIGAPNGRYDVNSRSIGKEAYLHYARTIFPTFSDDEVENLYFDLTAQMGHPDDPQVKSVFFLLTNFTKDVLLVPNAEPICRASELLNWRNISFLIGQDILTAAHLAWQDSKTASRRKQFCWPVTIGSDDAHLRDVLNHGFSENHFHLHGSTQSFPLSWICLMNHPKLIGRYLRDQRIAGRMFENLQDTPNLSVSDVHLPWEERLNLAAELRALLFKRCELLNRYGASDLHRLETISRRKMETDDGQNAARKRFVSYEIHMFEPVSQNLQRFTGDMSSAGETGRLVEALRFQYGARYAQPNGRYACLDYAIPTFIDQENNALRSLAGERYFLYGCFIQCFQGAFLPEEQDIFYLYLLLKAQFRNELIQVNQRVGFRNFAAYQDRKNDFFSAVPEYRSESIRLSLGSALKAHNVQALEARYVPKPTLQENVQEVLQLDALAEFGRSGNYPKPHDLREQEPQMKHFYTLHFIKRKPEKAVEYDGLGVFSPRNANVRKTIRNQAAALAAAIERDEYLCRRVRGIDAASNEIGCRPEVFAPEFRFLRGFTPNPVRRYSGDSNRPSLGITYHVGEDFLDIANGLRAIDEAVRFLELRRGDRLGHALALGVDPRRHYALKGGQIVLSKQERLDDLVWILYRGNELGVMIPPDRRYWLEVEAQKLLHELYSDGVPDCDLLRYYQSWKLRGDAPELYMSGRFVKPVIINPMSSYRAFQYIHNEELETLRTQKQVTSLYRYYHYGFRKKGETVQVVEIEDWYMELIRSFQDRMQVELAERGLAIECNPTSNVLIGTFSRYEHHPIFRFNRYRLDAKVEEISQLSVSINTDDQGVFDTSLENEYAMLAACMRWHENGALPKYSDDQIYDYLNHIRQMGNLQSFAKNSRQE